MHMNMHTWAFAAKPMPYAWVSQYIPLPWPRGKHGNQVWPITLWQSWDPNPNACRASAWALTHTTGSRTQDSQGPQNPPEGFKPSPLTPPPISPPEFQV